MFLQIALKHSGAAFLVGVLAIAAMVLGETHVQAQADPIVLTINDENILQSEFYSRLQRVKGADFLVNTNPPGMRNENAGYIVLNSLINERLILQLAAKEKLTPTKAEIDTDFNPLLMRPDVVKAIADHLVTPDELHYDVTVQKARYNLTTNRATVTSAEIEKFYNDNINSYRSPERWELSAIRTSKVDDAAKVINELKAGKSFEDTARTYSEDERTKALGGKIGAFNINDNSLPEPISKAVRDLKVGQITEPISVKFDTGTAKIDVYWIVKLTGKQEASQRQLGEVRTQVERLATLQKVGGLEVGDKKIADFRKTSTIKINLAGYDQLLNPTTH